MTLFKMRAGQIGARDNVSLQIQNIVEEGYKSLGERPVVIGEIGLPMDMKCVHVFLGSQLPCSRSPLLPPYLLTSIYYVCATWSYTARAKHSRRMISSGRVA